MLVEISLNLFQIASLDEKILEFWQYKLVWNFKGVCFFVSYLKWE